jgi:hypothetical protein
MGYAMYLRSGGILFESAQSPHPWPLSEGEGNDDLCGLLKRDINPKTPKEDEFLWSRRK